jgi:hypothetical protein
MQEQDLGTSGGFSSRRRTGAMATSVPVQRSSGGVQNPLRRLDPLYSQLSHLGLVTPQFKQVYCFNRRQALNNLLQELTLVQRLYAGSPLEVETGHEALQTRAMELNSHLMLNAGFGGYSGAEKINILYQLRRALEAMVKQHFAQ